MRAARLRHRLQLQQQSESQDSTGGVTVSWTTKATVWGAIEALMGYEHTTADQVQSDTVLRCIIRYDSSWSSLDSTWRVKDANSGKAYEITSVIQPEHRSRPNTMIEMQLTESDRDDD